jgi:hypothetical protein
LASSSRAWASCALMSAPLGGEGGGAIGPIPGSGRNFPVAGFHRVHGARRVVGVYHEALPRGIIAPGTGVITGSGTSEKSHSAYPCEVAGESSSAEPGDDSSPAEVLGSLTAEVRRAGGAPHAAAPVEATYAVVATRRPRGHCVPETEHSPVGAAVVSLVGAPRCDAARAACRRSVRAFRERCLERRRRRGAEGSATSVLAGVDPPTAGATGAEAGPVCRRARSS